MRAGFCVLLYLFGYMPGHNKAPAILPGLAAWSGLSSVIKSFLPVFDCIGTGRAA
jgi:hypothetical protein